MGAWFLYLVFFAFGARAGYEVADKTRPVSSRAVAGVIAAALLVLAAVPAVKVWAAMNIWPALILAGLSGAAGVGVGAAVAFVTLGKKRA